MSEDFPSRVKKARYHLRKYLRDALKENKKAYLKYDKLIIEEELYEYDSTLEDIVLIRKEEGGRRPIHRATSHINNLKPNSTNPGLHDLNLDLACWNIEGLLKYESSVQFKELIKEFVIFGFCETWSKCTSEFDAFINGYKCFNKIRKKRFKKGRNSGGVAVFVKYALIEGGFCRKSFQ